MVLRLPPRKNQSLVLHHYSLSGKCLRSRFPLMCYFSLSQQRSRLQDNGIKFISVPLFHLSPPLVLWGSLLSVTAQASLHFPVFKTTFPRRLLLLPSPHGNRGSPRGSLACGHSPFVLGDCQVPPSPAFCRRPVLHKQLMNNGGRSQPASVLLACTLPEPRLLQAPLSQVLRGPFDVPAPPSRLLLSLSPPIVAACQGPSFLCHAFWGGFPLV